MTRLLIVEPGYCPYQAGFPSAMAAASEVIEGESQILKPFGTPRIGLICPTYTYVNTSTVNADQCIPGDHYGNQIRIWGGLNQLSLGAADDLPAVFSADEGEETSLLDFCA